MGIIKAIPLTDEQAEAVERLVATGLYADASDVVTAFLDALTAKDAAVERWLRMEVLPVAEAVAADPSLRLTGDQVTTALEARFAAWERAAAG